MSGISPKKLAKHVYNHYCTLFSQPDFGEVYRYVQNYLKSHSRQPQDAIESAQRWGCYRLNTRSQKGQQLLSQFREEKNKQTQEDEKPPVDLSLSLFPDD